MHPTVSLEMAKRLKEGGFLFPKNQFTFIWVKINEEWLLWYWKEFQMHRCSCLMDNKELPEYYTCPTTDEILSELPWRINKNHYPLDFMITRGPKNFTVWYQSSCELPKRGNSATKFVHESLAECLANCWLYLNQEGLLEKDT